MDKTARETKERFEAFLKRKLMIGSDTAKYATSLNVKMRKVASEAGISIDSLYNVKDDRILTTLRNAVNSNTKMVYGRAKAVNKWDEGMKWYMEFIATPSPSPDSSPAPKPAIPRSTEQEEGKHVKREHIVISRNREARRLCIQHYGCVCAACEVSMSSTYGELGEGFIEVHHRKPIHLFDESHIVDPVDDLIPLCPNCHSMIHKLKDVGDLDTLKKIIQENKR